MVTMSHKIYRPGGVEIFFSAKPPAAVLAILKANGYRWTREGGGYWWKHRAGDAADLIAALQVALDRAQGVVNYYKCWGCGSDKGIMRSRGAAAPVWCDECNAKDEAARKDSAQADAALAAYVAAGLGEW